MIEQEDTEMRLTSSAFANGDSIPRRFTCDGEDISPPLTWSDPPAGVRSFALICADPDAPRGTWYHWAIYDIPAAACELAEHWPRTRHTPPQAINDFGKPGYGGPCPPPGAKPHHYHFTLYALTLEHLAAGSRPHCREIEAACKGALAMATLVGRYGRPPN
jgi:Raf kinase inhibitor-like YbhB/YbcL family protein